MKPGKRLETPVEKMIRQKTALIKKNEREVRLLYHTAKLKADKIRFHNKVTQTLVDALKAGKSGK